MKSKILFMVILSFFWGKAGSLKAQNVAQIGDTFYSTLEEAFKNAENYSEITLTSNVTLPSSSEIAAFEIKSDPVSVVRNITLDLNGYNINTSERTGHTGKTNYAFDNYEKLTIVGKGTITARGIQNYGTLTIEGDDVTIISNDEAGFGACLWGYEGSATIIKGGTFKGLAKGAGAINTEGSLQITGGTFSADGKQDEGYHVYTIQCNGINTVNTISGATLSSGRHGVIAVTDGAKLTIDNVTTTREGVTGQSGHVLYVSGSTSTLTINGGTFVNKDASAGSVVIYTDANSTTHVTGGTFTNQGEANVISGTGTTKLTSGNYSNDVTSYCADGYISQKNDQGTWDVIVNPQITGEAMIAGQGYETLEKAIEAANEDDDEDEVVLLTDVTIESKINVTKSLVLNGNNKTLTYTSSDRAIDVSPETNGANLSVKNLSVQFVGNYRERGINYNTTGQLTLHNVTVGSENCYPTYAVNLPTSSDDAVVNISNSTMYACIALNIWGERTTITADNSTFTSVDKNTEENYTAISLNNDGLNSADDSSFSTINGGRIIAKDQNSDHSTAIRVAAIAAVNLDPNTEIIGKIIYPVAIVYYNNTNNFYTCLTLKDAIKKADETNAAGVRLIHSIQGSGIVIDNPVLIDFNGKTYTFVEPAVGSSGTETNGFQILQEAGNVTLKNGTLNVHPDFKDKFYILIQNYANLTVENMTLDGTNLDKYSGTDGYSYTLSNNSGEVNIINSIIHANNEGNLAVAFDVCKFANYPAPVVNLDAKSQINNGTVEHSGGQLYTAQDINVKYVKSVEGSETGWGTISSPIGTVAHTAVSGLINGTHDLYRYNEANMEWEFVTGENAFTEIEAGRGYLYANTATTNVVFNGLLKANPSSVTMDLAVTENALPGFHMIGNPFAHNINENNFSTTDGAVLANGFYVISESGAWVAKTTETIAPMESVLIKTNAETQLSINPTAASKSRSVNNGQLEISVSNAKYSDVAYVSFDKGIGLDKIEHRNANIPMVYVPVNGTNYSVAIMSKDVTEIPVSFVAKTMGEYTIGVEAQDCEFAQMYLIDKMTGYSTNLLLEDYTFMATSKDNADRFIIRLVNSFDQSFGAENFVIFSNDEMMINDIQGEGIIRIVDVLGRPIAEYNVFGSANISTTSFRSGAYMIQVIDESGIKVQKIIID